MLYFKGLANGFCSGVTPDNRIVQWPAGLVPTYNSLSLIANS